MALSEKQIKNLEKTPGIDQTLLNTYKKNNPGSTPKKSVVDAPEDAASRISKFGSALNVAIDKARQQRKDSTLDFVGGIVPAGALPASSFASVLSAFDSDSAPLEATLVDNAMDFAKEEEQAKTDAQNSIRELALKVAEVGGSSEVMASVLAFSESGDIDAAIKAAGAALSAGSGDIRTVGGNLVKVMPDGTYEVIYTAPKSGGGSNTTTTPGGAVVTDDLSGLKAGEFKEKLKATVDPAFYAALDTQYNDAEMRQFYEFWINMNNQEQMTVRADIALAEWVAARSAAGESAGIEVEKKTATPTTEEKPLWELHK